MAENKQRTVWRTSDERVLIDLWRERAGDFRRAKRNLHIYTDISVQMAHKFTPKEVHVKIRNLIQKYREEKKKVGPSGGSLSAWKHFDAVHQIIGLTTANNVETYESFTVDTSSSILLPFPSPTHTASPLTSLPSLSPLDSSSASIGTSATRKRDYVGELLKVAKEQNELLKTVVEDGKKLTERVVNAIEQQNNTTKEFIDIMKSILEKM